MAKSGRADLAAMMDSVEEASQQRSAFTDTPSNPPTIDSAAETKPPSTPDVGSHDPQHLADRAAPKSRRKRGMAAADAKEARRKRDEEMLEALKEYGVDPSTVAAPSGRTKESMYRPTVEMSPEVRAGITAACHLHPDLFPSIRAFVAYWALNWRDHVDEG